MAQPRSQRDQARVATMSISSNSREGLFNDQASRMQSPSVAFASQQPNAISMMFQRSMHQLPMIGGGIPMMTMNPMAIAMGMGMNGFNQMGGMNGMNMMNLNGTNGVGNMGAMRLGVGPMGGAGMGVTGMAGHNSMNGLNSLGMGMRTSALGGGLNTNMGRMMNTGPGPSRMTSRGQHSFHPYAR